MKKRIVRGALIASAVASMFAATLTGAAEPGAKADKEQAQVHCAGVNACKGQGACKSAKNDCAGKNGCKGQGFVKMSSEKECTDKGGKVLKD